MTGGVAVRTTRTDFWPGSCSTAPPCAAALPATQTKQRESEKVCFDCSSREQKNGGHWGRRSSETKKR